MSNKINLTFFNAYMELDKMCADLLGVKHSGVSSYINRLVDYRFAPGRNDVLPKLIKYRNCRNAIAHEVNTIREMTELSKADIKWIHRFIRKIKHRSDPVSCYERKAKAYSIWRKFYAVFVGAIIAVVGVFLYFILKDLGLVA